MKIEIGWVLVGVLDRADRAAASSAREWLRDNLRSQLPELDWHLTLLEQPGVQARSPQEPSELFEIGVAERDARGWDFVIVVTNADLVSHYQRTAMAVPATALNVGVISTARIDPEAEGRELDDASRREVMTRRIAALGLTIIGRLNGVDVGPTGGAECDVIAALDRLERLPSAELDELRGRLFEVADPRLEEEGRLSGIRFFVGACWRNSGLIAQAVRRARPWTIPFRLSRLTTAAVSAVVILIMTAETWDVALVQNPVHLTGMSALVWVGTTWFVLTRQRIGVGRLQRTEQAVASSVIATVVVALGMLVTYACLFALVMILSLALFPSALVDRWAGAASGGIGDQLRAAGFLATLGLVIGALGASFEERRYLNHITYADEEI